MEVVLLSASSSSSTPKESLPFAAGFRFFLNGCLDADIYPSLDEGVPVPDADVKRPKLPPWASRSFCSRASARRFRKSVRWTRPTVWDLRRSSAVAAWEVNREVEVLLLLGVGARDRSVEEGVDEVMVYWLRD
ncbi:MAG: hypothetical protein Q9228_002685 [Teloschistes exilis]